MASTAFPPHMYFALHWTVHYTSRLSKKILLASHGHALCSFSHTIQNTLMQVHHYVVALVLLVHDLSGALVLLSCLQQQLLQPGVAPLTAAICAIDPPGLRAPRWQCDPHLYSHGKMIPEASNVIPWPAWATTTTLELVVHEAAIEYSMLLGN